MAYGGGGFAAASSNQATAGGAVECLICMEDHPVARTAKLDCGHRMCNGCIKRLFMRSVADAQDMPPKCCTADPIPLEHVDDMFDSAFKRMWNRKLVEFSALNRLYCSSKKCGEWIKPSNIRIEAGRRLGQCARCRTKVCGTCSGKWHSSKSCPRENFIDPPRGDGRKGHKCYRCKAMVEPQVGCLQMSWWVKSEE